MMLTMTCLLVSNQESNGARAEAFRGRAERREPHDVKVLVFGAGAVGGSVCGWIASRHASTRLLARGKTAEAIRANGITLYRGDRPDKRDNVPVKVVSQLNEAADADVVLLAVKNYSLDEAAKQVRDALGDRPIIVGLQNGVENQAILPRYFSRVIYGIVGYNAWVDAPGVIGYQKKGPLVLGVLDSGLQSETRAVAETLNRGVETVVTDRFQDAAHSKLILNLTNSLTTLVGHTMREISSPALLQSILSNMLYEGIQIVRAAGYREWRIGGMPGWPLMTASAKLPRLLTRGLFKRNLKKMVLSSMAQDVIRRGGRDSELDSINGYLLRLADQHGLNVPYNRAVYRICREEFDKPGFEPIDVAEVWRRILAMHGAP